MTLIKNEFFKNYLYYCLKNNLLRDLTIALISVIYLLTNLAELSLNNFNSEPLYVTGIIMALSFLMPILTFAKFNNKRNLDTIYSFPIERKKVTLTHYFSGAISLGMIYTTSFAVYLGFLLVSKVDYHIGNALLFYVLTLCYGILIYTVYSFIFTKANTTFDGIIFCITWTFMLVIVVFAFITLVYRITKIDLGRNAEEVMFSVLIQRPLLSLNRIFEKCIEIKKYYGCVLPAYDKVDQYNVIFGGIAWTLISILSGFGLIKEFTKKGADKAGEVSTSIFGYKLFIPLLGLSVICIFYELFKNIITESIVLILMATSYFVYRRSFKLKKSDIIILAIVVVIIIQKAVFIK